MVARPRISVVGRLQSSRGQGLVCLVTEQLPSSVSTSIREASKTWAWPALEGRPTIAKGDLVFHVEQGIAEFVGSKQLAGGDFVELRFANDDRLFVPVEAFDLLVRKHTDEGVGPGSSKLE